MNNMNRRSFMKGLAGIVAGVSVLKAEEPKKDKDYCDGQNRTLCPRCKFNQDKAEEPKEQNVELTAYGSKHSAGIDPNSDWAKPQMIALEDIPKGKYGWVRIGQQWEADI